jgi:predicted XRE-type DNA-binding protein
MKTQLGTIGSGNVFADLGLPNSEELMAKSTIVISIAEEIEKQGQTYDQAGETIGLSGSEMFGICNGRTEPYSIDRLNEFLGRLSATR